VPLRYLPLLANCSPIENVFSKLKALLRMHVARTIDAWLTRPPSARARSDEVVGAQIKASFVGSDRTYGARRVWHDVLAEGAICGLHRVERLMREQALRAWRRRRGLPSDQGTRHEAADNVLDRQFEATAPNQKWIADFT
jgi:putative transposase